jgi:hypothetical protein
MGYLLRSLLLAYSSCAIIRNAMSIAVDHGLRYELFDSELCSMGAPGLLWIVIVGGLTLMMGLEGQVPENRLLSFELHRRFLIVR